MNKHKFIHINETITEHEKIFTCAHELGHALLHPNINTGFLKNSTLLSVNKFEIEANTFAIHLLISDDELNDLKEYSCGQLAQKFGYPENLIKLRLKERSC